jgi:ATP-binding cassette subfamily B protein
MTTAAQTETAVDVGTGTAAVPVSRAADRLLLRAAWRSRWTVVLAAAAVAGAAVALLLPAALAAAVDAALHHRVAAGAGAAVAPLRLGRAAGRLAALLAAGALAEVGTDLGGACAAADTTAWLRRRLLGHTLALGLPSQARFGAGDLAARLSADAPAAGHALPTLLGAAVAAATALGAVVGLTLLDWRLAAAFLLGLPAALLALRAFVVQATGLFRRYQELQAAIAARLLDALGGIRTIRASGTEAREAERILAPLPDLAATGRALWRAQQAMAFRAALLVPALEILVLAAGGLLLAAGAITPGGLLAAAYVRLALSAFEQLDALAEGTRARVGAARVAEVLAVRPARVLPGSGTRALPDGGGSLSLRGVTVHAPAPGAAAGTGGGRPVLERLDLEVAAGTALALVGRSGAGKTTLAGLIAGLTAPDEGVVLLDGVPLDELAPAALREAVACAFERPALLGGCIHDTIAFGRRGASRAAVELAARAAEADAFIRRLPGGYDTPMAGLRLSGGEAQRLGLARAVAQGGRVLVLDDATSSLDTATEVKVQTALAALRGGRTCVVVAHRAATAARADLVAWLEGGRLRAVAPHAALWADPAYRAIFGPGPTPAAGERA